MALVLVEPTADDYIAEIRKRGDPNHIDSYGIPALCVAIRKYRSLHLVEELLKDGANVNRFTSMQGPFNTETRTLNRRWGNFSPLHIAIALGKAKIVRLLLDNGADPNALTSKGIKPLQILLYTSERYLLAEDPVSEEDELEILKMMVKAGSNFNVRQKSYPWTFLHWAIDCDKPDIARYLISVGCNVNDVIGGGTPLHLSEKNIECARTLLENSADPNAQDDLGETVYHKVMRAIFKSEQQCPREFIRLLHDYHINPNIRDNEGRTVLHVYFQYFKGTNGIELLEYLLEYGADINIADELDRTPPFYLAYTSRTEVGIRKLMLSVLKKLFQYGMKFNVRDIIGQPLFHILVVSCLPDVLVSDVSYFKRIMDGVVENLEVDINIPDFQNRTILHLLAAAGEWELAEILLNHGADLNAMDCDGNTPLHVAVECKKLDTAKNLRQWGSPRSNVNNQHFTDENYSQGNPTERFSRSKSISASKNDRRQLTPFGSSVSWTPKSLQAIRKYSDNYYNRFYSDILKSKRTDRRSRPNDSDQRLPTTGFSKEFFDRVTYSALLQTCEKHSVGAFHPTEKCDDEKCQIAEGISCLVRDLVEKCAEIDPRLESNLLWTGSTAEGTKMWAPDEFDFMMELTKLKDGCNIRGALNSPQVFVTEGSKLSWSDFQISSFKLSPTKIRDYVAAVLWIASLSLDRSKYPNITFNLCQYKARKVHFIEKTNVGVKLAFYWSGQKYKEQLIDVDLTPAIPLRLADERKPELNKRAVSRWSSNNCPVIPHISLKNDFNDSWRLSFSLAELELIRSMSTEQVNLYKCLKLLRDIHSVNNYLADVPTVPSYHLKSFIFNYVFGEKYFILPGFQGNICQALFVLHCVSQKADGYVEHFFLPHKPQSLLNLDMNWCSAALDSLEKNS